MRVVFGPWVGELGWELTSWQGWVRKVCQEEYRDHDKVIVTFPGREVLYLGIDAEFDPHPDWFQNIEYSPRAYATDFWTPNGPSIKRAVYDGPIMESYCLQMLEEYKDKYPDAIFVVPWERTEYKDIIIGGITQVNIRQGAIWVPKLIPKEMQSLEVITPSEHHLELLHDEMSNQGFDTKLKMILVFPRNRVKNSDKNWSVEYCEEVIGRLQSKFPTHLVCLVGSPDGAHFADGVPDGCLDLISIQNSQQRLNIHVAAMSQSDAGIGPASGIIHVAMWSGLRCVCNIEKRTHKKYPKRFTKDENPFNVRVKMICDEVPVDKVIKETEKMICRE